MFSKCHKSYLANYIHLIYVNIYSTIHRNLHVYMIDNGKKADRQMSIIPLIKR